MTAVDVRSAAISVVQLLASDADEQIGAFPSFVLAAEEIALKLQDVVLLMAQWPACDSVAHSLAGRLKTIDEQLETLSTPTNADFWNDEALATDVRWHRIRLEAREILRDLNISRHRPEMNDMYVPS